jgi:hypothetical protein
LAKSVLVLLDADVVIEAFRLGIWELLTNKSDIHVASSVVGEADHFFDPTTGQKHRIDLDAEAAAGRVKIVEGVATDMARVQDACKDHLDLHLGELESIAVVSAGGQHFCTADRAATKAMALLDMQDRAVSFETLLRKHGVTPKLKMKQYYSAETMNAWLKEGSILRVQTFGKKP